MRITSAMQATATALAAGAAFYGVRRIRGRMNLQGRSALITGGSRGLGLAIARALTGLSASMRSELVKDNILVTTVSPGLMRTGSPFNAWFKGRHREEFAWFTVVDSMPLLSVEAGRAARQIGNACRCGDAELVVGWPAKLAVIVNALMPEAVALGMRLTNALLPAPTDAAGDRAHSGWQSFSALAPSPLTRLTDAAAVENNQLGGVLQRP